MRPAGTDDHQRLFHDLNHALTAVVGALDGALGRTAADGATQADLLTAHGAATLAVRLLAGDGVRLEVLALADILTHAAPLLGPAGRVRLQLDDLAVLADRIRLERVLLNLATNAWQASGGAGLLTIRVGRCGRFATIAIEDSGTGLPIEQLPRLSDPAPAAATGRGLGLGIVRDLLDGMGGFVSAAPARGRGTIMTVHLPLAATASAGPAATAADRLVLLVEDEPMVRALAERALKAAGWRVLAVASAATALARAAFIQPDVVVSDATLPGMSGSRLIGCLRASWPALPAVLVSGYPESAVRDDHEGDNGGAPVVFLAKPYALTALIAAVERAVLD